MCAVTQAVAASAHTTAHTIRVHTTIESNIATTALLEASFGQCP